jgi:hypothetical protein
MSTAAITTNSQESTSRTDDFVELVVNPRNYLFLIPTIAAIAVGAIFIPHFGLGLAVGTADLVVSMIGFTLLDRSGILPRTEEKNSKYQQALRDALLEVSVFGPIAEEGVFRGIIQPLLTRTIQILLPAAAVAFFGTPLSIAVFISVVASSILFGAAHYMNPHKNAHIQAISATVGGLVYGFLSAQFGIGASMAAHIANNTLVSMIVALSPENNSMKTRRPIRVGSLPLPT